MRARRGDDNYAPADDDALFNDIHADYDSAGKELEGFRSSSDRLANAIRRDPRVGALFSAIANEESPESFPSAFARVFGRDVFDGDPEFESGYRQRRALEDEARVRAAKSQEAYAASLDRLSSEHGLTSEERDALHNDVMDIVEGILDGRLPEDMASLVRKGRRYDSDLDAARRSGTVEGKNAMVREHLKDVRPEHPDLARSSSVKVTPAISTTLPRRGSFFDSIDEKVD